MKRDFDPFFLEPLFGQNFIHGQSRRDGARTCVRNLVRVQNFLDSTVFAIFSVKSVEYNINVREDFVRRTDNSALMPLAIFGNENIYWGISTRKIFKNSRTAFKRNIIFR